MQLEAVIGLEIHAQIATATKMFCACDNDAFGKDPNTTVCPVCMGHPGTLPVANARAVELGAKAALALGCTVAQHTKFDRKNYFYPDLPAGYQISQYDEPLSGHGAVEIEVGGERKEVRILRLHLENDAGKLTHVGGSSLCDYNRAGTPLMEIVSEPDLRSAAEAKAYAEAVRAIVQYAGASNADMYKGELRFDASVSLRPVGEEKLYPRAEIKNLNSFRALEAAVAYEIARQTKLWEEGNAPDSETTVGWDDEKGETYLMRSKESAADYRYFPEPDLPPVELTPEQIEAWRSELPELPLARRQRLVQAGLTEADAALLVADKILADWYEEVVAVCGDAKKAASWTLTETLGRMKVVDEETNQPKYSSVAQLPFSARQLGELVKLIGDGTISGKQAKEVLDYMFAGEADGDPAAIAEAHGMQQVSDAGALESLVDAVLAEHAKVVEDFRAGKGNAVGFLVGQVMKASDGQANPKLVNEILAKKLNS